MDILRTPDHRFEALPGFAIGPHDGGGHILREDRGPELAEAVVSFVPDNPPV